ncbi:MAG TPA: porin [Thermoanaerobaculia bacterium]|jgi:phosphate-selective porin OprO/OprP|nr:porin [Thermoanaerobaculia bacterium]HPA49980.1 porin [Thermoanaerobaculia bacterium]HQN06148.1 porin [Thermoanaerobaculia bacterium]HQP85944.1 porin [Thermoanaerobaculia bacterium]
MKRQFGIPVLVALLAAPGAALAQSDAERIADLEKRVESLVKKDKERSAAEAKANSAKGTTLRSVSDKGKLEWASADGAYKFRLAGRAQLDGVFFSGDENRNGNALGLRRGRIGFKATVAKDWTAEFDVDFADNAVDIKDAYVGYEGIDKSAIRLGQFKIPYGYDQLVSSKDIWFVERAYVDAFAPGRRLGVGYFYGADRFSAAATLFTQGIGEDVSGLDQGWGWAARGTWAPVMPAETRAIHVGVAATGWQPDAAVGDGSTRPPAAYVVEFSSRPEVSKIAKAKYLNTGDLEDVDQVRQYGLELAGVWDAFAWQAEYNKTSVDRLSGAVDLSDHDFDGWYAQVSYVLGGKRKYAADEGLVDKVSPGKGGAWEIAARYSTMDLNDLTAVDPIKGGSAENYTLGLNYYPNFNIRLMLDWSIVDNDEYAKPKKLYGAIAGDDFSVLQFRVQYAF